MEILKIDISEIKEYKNNAKLHPKEQIEQIKKSIKEFGNNDPIAIDENNIIIEGHGRYLALKQLGYKEVDVIKLTHLSEEQKKAYILTHNKLTMNTNFDVDILNEELDEILNIDMSDFGFDILEDEKEVNQDTDYEEIDDKSVIIVEASSEKELEELYDEFVERGIICRVSIL
ncbi:ParB/Srx family N-terminal domain-containing protein [Streptococcus pyogenes]|uniref:ParB/Srx family N-terminal domain-containing protein n=1 Tax=Streptococcus pyogenes TaxID=1314 RepID=UPI000DFBE149|nr:ParB/Srx family N-terminal domain-containing protein [Streptococcus pyogenes]SUO63957.1 phage DNA methylase [Streptococcus pyogenes]